ncbi:MMPL family transporter [Austwickia chelonae]|uniref:MMPL family transporter n=1 Tax=Austwickia chelonae TaxID=100225 RepID=UPI000E270529|nr:MMPL family transporter [Austwickia chelonae]
MTRPVRLLALFVLLAWLVVGAVGGPLVGKLSSLQKNDQAPFLPVEAESKRAADEFKPFSSATGLPYFVVITREDGIREDDPEKVQRYIDALQDHRWEGSDRSLGDLLSNAPGFAVPSKDSRAFLVPISANPDRVTEKIGEVTGGVAIATALRSEAARVLAPSGLKTQVTGPGGFAADIGKAFSGIDGVLLLVALGVVLVILLFVYRSPLLPFAVLTSSVLGLAASALVIYPLADRGTIQVSGQSQGILSILVVGAATDYALLIVARYREELRRTDAPWNAMKQTWRGTVEPIAASAATVILGLLCLLFAQLGGTRGLGPISALGIVGALAASLTFLPAVLLLLGRRVFWPGIPRVEPENTEEYRTRSGAWGRVSELVGRRPRSVWVVVAGLLLLAASASPLFKADGLSQSQIFRTAVESVEGERTLQAHFPGGSGQPARVVVPIDRADRLIAAVQEVPGVGEISHGNAPGVPPKTVDGKTVVQIELTDPPESAAAQQTVRTLRSTAHRLDPSYNIGGQSATVVDTRSASEADVRLLLPTILGVVFLVLVVLLRSLVAPLLLILANVLSFAATIGVSALVFNHLLNFPGADPATPLYGFVFLIALGIDYSIFLMTRVREETPLRGTREATLTALAVTGGVITSAGVVLAATFSALLVLPLVFMAQIAFLVAFGVLLDTFVVRSLLIPGLVYDIGDRVWRPSHFARRVT